MKLFGFLIVMFSIVSSYACPELDGVDMASGESVPVYTVISEADIVLSKEEFLSMPEWKWADEEVYENCRESMSIKKMKHKKTGRIFNALISVRDRCDGGNSVGALYTENLLKRIADIGDSYISCYK